MRGPARGNRRGDARLVEDILQAIARVNDYSASFPMHGLAPDEGELVGDAIKYNLVIIGEAVGNLSERARDSEPSIPWTQIKGLRNLLAHEYMHINPETIREILAVHLPALEAAAYRMRALADEVEASQPANRDGP